jgi:hypothetical protein
VAPSSPDSRASREINVINPARASAAAGLTCDAKDLRRSSRPSRTRERAKAPRPRACCATMSGWNSRRTGTRGMATVLSPYQVVGDGRIDLVYLQEFLSNVILNWEHPAYARFQPPAGPTSPGRGARRDLPATARPRPRDPPLLTSERSFYLWWELAEASRRSGSSSSTASPSRPARASAARRRLGAAVVRDHGRGARGRARAAPGRFRLAAC